jgi:hypothetical protein
MMVALHTLPILIFYSTPITEPIQKNYIRRHRLQKDPSAAKVKQ